jgi:diaminohydroxyphosphoribosylaminopyrimidine deaminase/5-amino-6-(5-phosphoribosylamino)uracil reductase
MSDQQDNIFMVRAIQLAKRGNYTTDPNPRVGCVLVRNDVIIAEGWHAWAGQGHAEIVALAKTNDAFASTPYITLEPCSHHGQTPPCCDALIKAGVARVVTAMQDPNPLVTGTGHARLRAAGVKVECGVQEEDARALNPGFIKRMETGLPYLTSKIAMSLDGRTAMASGESKWITSTAAREDVHRLRAASSAILTGINTVLADDPGLNARLNEEAEVLQPVRIVLDSTLKTPVTAKMLGLPGSCIILTGVNNPAKQQQLEQAGFQVVQLSTGADGRINLHEVLRFLGKQQMNEVLIEAGAVLNGALLANNLVDQWVFYMAPTIFGDEGLGLFRLPGLRTMTDKKQLVIADIRKIGSDLRLKLLPRK